MAGKRAVAGAFFWTDADNQGSDCSAGRADTTGYCDECGDGHAGFKIHERQRRMKEVAELTALPDIRAYPVGWPEGDDE
ncbi:hypothetical protein ACLB1M_00195 [Escherichia coli]